MRLRANAPGKVNLCLFLGPVRDDGRHELVTVFESVSLADSLLLTTSAQPEDEVVCPGVEGPNLAAAALAALRARGWGAPPVRIEIEKRIPIAAGMAGGSADAAAVLRLASELAPGRPEEIAAIAASLGADVPSQLIPGLTLGTGAGELIEPLLPLADHACLVLPSEYTLSTADVYEEADRLRLPRRRAQLAARQAELRSALHAGGQPPDELLVNDLQPAALSLCPEIAHALDAARDAGADHTLVCGSGPTVVGLYWGEDGLAVAQVAAGDLAGHFPGATAVSPVQAEYGFPVIA